MRGTWDGVRWARDDTGEITRRASESVLTLYAEAEQLEDRLRRAELVKHAMRSEADSRIAAAIHLARADARVAVRPDAFDTDPWALNVVNGTIDLRTGELRAHRRADLITKLSPVAYDPETRLELWDTFLLRATGGDPQLLRYLQRVAGYSLTGDTREEILLFLHGPTAAGKSTLVESVKSAAGDYAVTADFDTFLARRDSGPQRHCPARRSAARRLDRDGGGSAPGGGAREDAHRRRRRERAVPVPRVVRVPPTGEAVARREHQAAREQRGRRYVAPDPAHPLRAHHPGKRARPRGEARLRDPAIGGPGVLAWAVQGCVAWRREGLKAPERVALATASYRDEMDELADFLADRCVLAPNAHTPASELYAAYVAWAHDTGERRTLSSREFGRRLGAHDVGTERGTGGARLRRGIRLQISEPLPTLEAPL